jgi:hypothetical protein
MIRIIALCVLISGCHLLEREPPAPEIRVDTVTVTQTVEPPLPEAQPVEVCLSNGVTVQMHITAENDTLIGERRVSIRQLRPAVAFAGTYAQDHAWFRNYDVVRFDGRGYQRAGVERTRVCDELKLVGEHLGVPVFAEVTAPQVLPLIVIPVRPGVYQDYLRVGR